MHRHLRAALTITSLLLPLACGPSEEEKRVRAVAGTYVHEYETDPATDPAGARIHERQTLTLRPDRTWTMARFAEVNGSTMVDASTSGRFGLDGASLIARSAPQGDDGESFDLRYTVSGDTLWTRSAHDVAVTKAVTGIDMKAEETFLVRQR
ncbi:MAG TPA: hypothetical protein VFJ74_07130 [Gemmatimonadaceae bacterium]|nr:hypothetical protein [Gemmatimonadaceae bacterium]